MKKHAIAALSALALLSAAPARAEDDMKLITILTAPNAQTQLMGMVLTMQAVQQGAAAHVLLCGDAADIALKDAPAAATAPQKPKGMSPQALLVQIMARPNTSVEVCAIYLPNKGVDASALLDGVTPADPAVMARRLLADDTRIMSF
jgi:intracellular sulfur oxidation DsrE/DsrF family protein